MPRSWYWTDWIDVLRDRLSDYTGIKASSATFSLYDEPDVYEQLKYSYKPQQIYLL